MQKLNILYEDNHLIAVNKPAGILVQADDSQEPCLMDLVKAYLKEKYHKPGNVFLGLVHRLDRPVSGIVVFARTSKGAARLCAQIREHQVKKTYTALVHGHPPELSGTLLNYLEKNEVTKKAKIYERPKVHALRAELDYAVIQHNKYTCLLKIDLKTGRFHQIRAQLAHLGCPIIGDLKYGGKNPFPDQSIGLSATSFIFKHPTQDKTITLEIPLPQNWRKFLV